MANMFFLSEFTGLLLLTIFITTEGSSDLNHTSAYLSIKAEIGELKSLQKSIENEQHEIRLELAEMRSNQASIKEAQQEMRLTGTDIKSILSLIRSDQNQTKAVQDQIKSVQYHIKADLQANHENTSSTLNILNSNFEQIKRGQTTLSNIVHILRRNASISRSCAETMSTSASKRSGIYEIVSPIHSYQPFKVACDAETEGGDWTIILRRMDGSVDFDRKWDEYKEGFGNLSGEYFLGLDKIHAITNDQEQELLVILEDSKGKITYTDFQWFSIGDERESYKLYLNRDDGSYSLFEDDLEMKFSSPDRQDDWSWCYPEHACNLSCPDERTNTRQCDCAKQRTNGWWYSQRFVNSQSNLMGRYNNGTRKGIHLPKYLNCDYTVKRAIMMIRPKKTLYK